MNQIQTKKIFTTIQEAQSTLKSMTRAERDKLEKRLDVEHAYYSSSLEGSKLCREDFEKLGKKIK